MENLNLLLKEKIKLIYLKTIFYQRKNQEKLIIKKKMKIVLIQK